MIFDFGALCRRDTSNIVEFDLLELASTQGKWDFDAMISLRLGRLHAATTLGSVCSYVLYVDCRCHNFYVIQRELRALGNDFAVDRNERASIVVEAIAVTPLLIGIQVYPS